MSIDWKITFDILNNDENLSETSFSTSSRKSNKIKMLIEELPYIEHIKKRRPDLYKNWLCPVCEDEREFFAHIWSCPATSSNINYVINTIKQELIDSIKFIEPKLKYRNLNIDHSTLWLPSFDLHEFTFIDLIKGIVPEFLVEMLTDMGLS